MTTRVALLRHNDCALHDTGYHPEAAGRLAAIGEGLAEAGLFDRLQQPEIREVTDQELLRVHDPGMVETARRAVEEAPVWLDPDTMVSDGTLRAALLAAGSGVTAADGILAGEYDRAFCCVRPPGHHAGRRRSSGFCIFNNIAVVAAHLLHEHDIERVLIVDFDVHHGNGTQEIFYDSDRVFYLSAHLINHYPYRTGYTGETGRGIGEGFNLNLPFRAGASAEEYLETVRPRIRDVAESFRPEFVLISAGFDSHVSDPLGGIRLEADDFGSLTRTIVEATESADARGPISFLEGGYHLPALAESVIAHVRALF
jgi:acetoin utilization deacetylase AcuC-like enzyme